MSPLAIYNTLTRRKETFVPIVPGRAGIYVCGPTVYDYIHIGNARTFAVFDLVVRWLRSSGYAVTYVRNSAVRENDPSANFHFGSRPGSFRYQPEENSRSTFALTAAGITILHGAGVYSDADIESGMRRLEEELVNVTRFYGRSSEGHYFFYYGHYYAVQAFHIAGGERYRHYLDVIQRELLIMQKPDGSFPNSVGPGPAYGTATACLILQMPKEYLPIFQR